jgi:hypothetical protein
MGSSNAHECIQYAENGFGFDFFLSDTKKMAINFSITYIMLTGDETWISFVNIETKE